MNTVEKLSWEEYIPAQREKALTIADWLKTIPNKEVREKAIANMDLDKSGVVVEGLSVAIVNAFTWADTPEGNKYWSDFFWSLDV